MADIASICGSTCSCIGWSGSSSSSSVLSPCQNSITLASASVPKSGSNLSGHGWIGSAFATGSSSRLSLRHHCGGSLQLARGKRNSVTRAAVDENASAAGVETYEVELEKPFGLRFYKGADGGTFIDAVAPGSSADQSGVITEGDKVLATSAMFGTEMWPAAEYGRTMYTIKQRIGSLVMRVEKRYGKREDRVNAEQIAKERNAGALGTAIREIQIQNYLRKQEEKEQREDELNEGLKLYKAGQYQDALGKFETVLGMKPDRNEVAVASYNVSCCYAKLDQLEPGLTALGEAMKAGFDDYKTIREDPDLAFLRSSPKFRELLDEYDEPFLNENAFKAIKNVFGIFGRKK